MYIIRWNRTTANNNIRMIMERVELAHRFWFGIIWVMIATKNQHAYQTQLFKMDCDCQDDFSIF